MALNAASAQSILEGLAKMFSQNPQAGAPGGGGGGTPDIIPGGSKAPIVGGTMPALPPGSMAASLPQLSPGATPSGPRPMSGPQPAGAGQGFSFDNPKARNAAVVNDAIHSLTSYLDQTRQHKYEKQVEEAQGVVSTVLRTSLAVDKANAAGDKDTAKLIQDQANKMLGSKEAAKILKDINKPGSAAYFGAQKAYQGVMAEQQQKATLEETRAKIAAEYERAQAERARAEAERQKARSESPEEKQALAKLQGKQKLEQIDAINKALTSRQDAMIAERFKETQLRTNATIKAAQIHADAIKANKGDKQSQATANALTKAYSSIAREKDAVASEMAKQQKEIDDHGVYYYFHTKDADKVRANLVKLQSRADSLQKQFDVVEQKRSIALQYNQIMETAPPPEAAPAESQQEAPAEKDPDQELRQQLMDYLKDNSGGQQQQQQQ